MATIILVHGSFVDGSGWESVYQMLRKDGYAVRVAQHPTISLAGDVSAVKWLMREVEGPVLLVGHSYGGAVITEVGTDPQVVGLVYVAGFAPDRGESVLTLIQNPPPGAPVAPFLPPRDGYSILDRAKFAEAFAGDVDKEKAAFMNDAQLPAGAATLADTISEPAWRVRPAWYLVTAQDRIIPPDLQRFMAKRAGATVTEVTASHSVYVSQPQAVAAWIETAAKGVDLAAAA